MKLITSILNLVKYNNEFGLYQNVKILWWLWYNQNSLLKLAKLNIKLKNFNQKTK